MTKVRFFHSARDRIEAAAAWLHLAWSKRQAVIVFAPGSELADRLDRQLWLQPAGSFVPHCRADSPLLMETPIIISPTLSSPAEGQQLLNLGDVVPPEFSRFEEVIEIVSSGADKLPARERFRFYRERGYELHNQDISAGF